VLKKFKLLKYSLFLH